MLKIPIPSSKTPCPSFPHVSRPETPEFKRWFKNSKVVDQDGKPLVVYHGSGTKFWEFKNEFTGIGNDQYGPGFYFTSDQDVAHGYTTRRMNDQIKPGGEDNPTVMPVYLSIQNPIVFDGKNDTNLRSVELSHRQAFELMKRCPGILEEESPIGEFSEEFWENGGSVSLLQKIANQYDWNLETMLGNIFRDNGKEFRRNTGGAGWSLSGSLLVNPGEVRLYACAANP